MDRQTLDDACEKGIFGLIVAMLVFGPLATGAVRPFDFLVIQGLTLGVLVLWTGRWWVRSGHRFLFAPICWAVLAFVAYAIIRYRQAPLEYVARSELIRILVYAVVFFAILDNLNRQEYSQWIALILIFLGMVISLYAVYQVMTNSPYVWHFLKPAQYMKRGSGTYICPNHLAGYLELVLPLGFAYTLGGRLNHTLKVFVGYASLVMLAGLGATVSRGGWVAAGLALLIFFLVLIRNRDTRLPAIVFVVLLTSAGLFFVKKTYKPENRFALLFDDRGVGDIRFHLWKPALEVWHEHRWWGGGPGHFDHLFRKHRPLVVQRRPQHPHNDYLTVLADWGLAGAALILAIFAALAAGIVKTWKYVQRSTDLSKKSSNRFALLLGAGAGLLALLLHSIVDFNMQIPANALIAVALMALLTSHIRFATERFWVRTGFIGKIVAAALTVAALLYLGQQQWLRSREVVYIRRAERTHKDPVQQFERLKLAHAVEPTNFDTAYWLGENLRLRSWEGLSGYDKLAQEALAWFTIAAQLNPFDPYPIIRSGMCLDWLGKHDQAAPYFTRAIELDPNNHYLVALHGWHFIQTRDYPTAKLWFEKSLKIFPWENDIARNYLGIVQRHLTQPKPNPTF